MEDIELTEDQQAEFSVLFGSLFSIDLAVNYFEGLQPILYSRKNTFLMNKTNEATGACKRLYDVINREFFKKCTPHEKEVFQKAIEIQQDLVYGILGLNPDKQDKVRELVTQLMEEQ